MKWIQTGVLSLSFSLVSIGTSTSADEVVMFDAQDRDVSRSGTITDILGKELTLEVSGRTVKLPMSRVSDVRAEWSTTHASANQKFAARDFESAVDLYRQAFRDEPRRWVQRKILARVIQCYHNTKRDGEAAKMFARLTQDDPETIYFDTIPLAYELRRCPSDVRSVVQDWLSAGNRPAERLLAASWLLVDNRDVAIATLKELGRDASANVSSLAVTQLLRAEMLTLQESRIAWWREHVDSMPSTLRGGAYYLLGKSYARFGKTDDAVLAWLRVPVMYRDDVELSQRSLIESARVLTDSHRDEAKRLYRDAIEWSANSDLGKLATSELKILVP